MSKKQNWISSNKKLNFDEPIEVIRELIISIKTSDWNMITISSILYNHNVT